MNIKKLKNAILKNINDYESRRKKKLREKILIIKFNALEVIAIIIII